MNPNPIQTPEFQQKAKVGIAGRKPNAFRREMRRDLAEILPLFRSVIKDAKTQFLAEGNLNDKNLDKLERIWDKISKYSLAEVKASPEIEEVVDRVLECAADYVPAERWNDFTIELAEAMQDT